ncbi:MAG TPA: hypothetical protein VGJ20_37200 [Xanthobacteraceae bacterium]
MSEREPPPDRSDHAAYWSRMERDRDRMICDGLAELIEQRGGPFYGPLPPRSGPRLRDAVEAKWHGCNPDLLMPKCIDKWPRGTSPAHKGTSST